MSTSKDYITYLEEKTEHIAWVKTRAMFWEYALYKDGIVVGLICDNIFYIKITSSTTNILWEDCETWAPYPWAKLQYIVPEELLEERNTIKQLIEQCAKELPKKVKKKK